MTSPVENDDSLSSRPPDRWLDELCDRFESVWKSGQSPEIAEFMAREASTMDLSARRRLLYELIPIDMAYRWRARAVPPQDQATPAAESVTIGDPKAPSLPPRPKLEDYAAVFPECGPVEQLPVELIVQEYRVRVANGDQPSPLENAERFGMRDDVRLATTEGPGTLIGPYKLLQRIGEGGFGVVYMAEQAQPVRRTVALKIIKRGMDTAHVIARFESERQALALMDHPHISKVLDAGATASGRPYFVMELVKGVPITEFCDKNRMTAEDRLKLFVDVCHAIQHAHHKGVIHRDIKPSNVMVTLHDGVPVVKVIDFGVAKATVQKLTERTLFTAYGQMIGTPVYMSPEQAEMSGLDIDTRSDVYSLGVLLYELLTGTTPLDPRRMREASYNEMVRLICEEETPRPSTRLPSLGERATSVANDRGTDLRRLRQLLAADLDWIVIKALEKDRNRRYVTPETFAEDIERYLRRDAILARPPSAVYKLKKFTSRNLAAVLTTVCVAAAMLTGTGVATWQAIVATQARKAANDALGAKEEAAQAALKESTRANLERTRAERQLHRAEWLLYANQIATAKREWETNNVELAWKYRAACRPDFRGWEHDYLYTLFNQNQQTLQGHSGSVNAIAFSPDGRRIVSGGDDKTIRIWDATTGQETLTLSGHTELVSSVAFSPNGTQIVSSSPDGTLRTWNATSGQESLVLKLRGTPSHVDVAPLPSPWDAKALFSPDGNRVVSYRHDGPIVVRDATSGQELLTLDPEAEGDAKRSAVSIRDVAISPDGKRIICAAAFGRDVDSKVLVWDAVSGEKLLEFPQHEDVLGIAISPDGSRLAGGGYKSLRLWDTASGNELLEWSGHSDSVSFDPAGSRIAGGSAYDTIKIWDASSGQDVTTFKGHRSSVMDVVFSPDGTQILSGSRDGTLKLWDTTGRQGTRSMSGPAGEISSFAISPDSQRIAVAAHDGLIKVSRITTGQELLTIRCGFACSCVAFSPDGAQIVGGDFHGVVQLWDATSGREVRTLKKRGGDVTCVAISPDGARIASGSWGHLRRGNKNVILRIWDTSDGRELVTIGAAVPQREDVERYVLCLAFSPDGRRLASGHGNHTVEVRDVSSGRIVHTLKGHSNGVTGVAYSPNGETIVTGCRGMLKTWDEASGRELLTIAGFNRSVQGISSDGKRIFVGTGTGVSILDETNGVELLSLTDNPNSISHAVFSPDGKRIVSGGAGNMIKVWEATSRMPIDSAKSTH